MSAQTALMPLEQTSRKPPTSMKGWGSLRYWQSSQWRRSLTTLKTAKEIVPAKKNLFKPLLLTPLKKVRVVMLDEAPSNQSDGLAFSSQAHGYENASLDTRLMICEAISDVRISEPRYTTLEPWAREGVFLWNIRMIGRPGKLFEDMHYEFTDLSIEIIQRIARANPKVVFAYTSDFVEEFLDEHLPSGYNISRVRAPSVTSGKFMGSRLFSRINEQIEKNKAGGPIKWRLK